MTSATRSPENSLQPSAQVQADFYSKLARLQDVLLSQQHPRFALSSREVEKLRLALKQASLPIAPRPEAPAAINGSPINRTASSPKKDVQSFGSFSDGSRQQNRDGEHVKHMEATSPSINPVLLTKSDDLVKAETNLKRMRIERSLRESAAKAKKDYAKDKDLGSWLGPVRFDVAKVWEEATSLVAPLSGLKPAVAEEDILMKEVSGNSSSEENSYYSSQVNSWTKSPGDQRKSVEGENLTAAQQHDVEQPIHLEADQQFETNLTVREPRVSGLGLRHEKQENPSAPSDKPPLKNLQAADATDSSGNSQTFLRDFEELREESYSPPGVSHDELPESVQHTPHARTVAQPVSRNPQRRFSYEGARTRESESYSPPPPPEVPVVPNNLVAPIAPQPSRVTPLALGNLESDKQHENHARTQPIANQGSAKQEKKKTKNQKAKESKKAQNTSDNGARRASGQQATVASRPKKRKDLEVDNEEQHRRNSGQRARASPSPIPYIKQEPLSPPPLNGRPRMEAPRRLVLRDDGGADMEVMAPRYAQRHGFHDENYGQLAENSASRIAPSRASRYVEEEPIVISPSPPVRRRPTRDDANLRRFASLQLAAQPYSPASFVPTRYAEDMRYTATPPPPREYQYYDDAGIRPLSQHQFRPRRSPPLYPADEYYTQMPQGSMQPPPKRRIVVDQYGNEYIAVPATSAVNREPMRTSSLQAEPRYYEHGPHPGAPTQVIALDEEEDDSQLMPPPAPPQVVPRKRPMDVREDRSMLPHYVPMQAAPRSASLQPARRSEGWYQYMPGEGPPWPSQREQPIVRDRAYSARPNVAQQEDYYNGQYGRGEGPAWR